MVAFAAGCGDDDEDSTTADGSDLPTEVGEGEGELNLVGWAGYVEDGSTDPEVDWVTDFEKETGCQVNFKIGGTSDEMVQLMRTGQYDGVSASGDASGRLVEGGDVAPVNVDLVPNYADVFDALKDQPLQHVRRRRTTGSRTAAARTCSCTTPTTSSPAPKSWDVVFDKAERLQRQGDRVRQPDLHRRRGAVPARAQAGARDRRSVRARPGAVRRRDRPAQAAEREHRRVLVRRAKEISRVRERRPRRSAPRGSTRRNLLQARGRARSRSSCPRRARPAGRTRG